MFVFICYVLWVSLVGVLRVMESGSDTIGSQRQWYYWFTSYIKVVIIVNVVLLLSYSRFSLCNL